MMTDKGQSVDIENQDNLLEFIKGVLDSVSSVVTQSCRLVDLDYFNSYDVMSGTRGTTCVMTLIVGDRLFCMNIGDSRAVLSRNKTAVLLSRDHKPVH